MTEDFVLVKVMEEIVSSITDFNVTFMPGRSSQVSALINEFDTSVSFKDKKYPLIAMKMPVNETHNGDKIFVRFDSIIIAQLNTEIDEHVLDRYNAGKTFPAILYPVYNGFMDSIARSKYVDGEDKNTFKHIKRDYPGLPPKNTGINDCIDCIEILNLELYFNLIKNC